MIKTNRKQKHIQLQWLMIFLLGIITCISLMSCKKYLDYKSDKKLIEPKTLEDAQALLDYFTFMNSAYSPLAAEADDDYYLTDVDYNKMTVQIQQMYTWDKAATVGEFDWRGFYQNVLYANMALETVTEIPIDKVNENDWKRIKGSALFYRAYNFYWLAMYYTVPYDESIAQTSPGIPLRLTADVNEKLVRGTLAATYNQIIKDLEEATFLLPNTTDPASRPSKAASYGALARVYMVMRKYDKAGLYADSCLQIRHDLIDYNTIKTTATTPFLSFNKEVVFHCDNLSNKAIVGTTAKIDTILYKSYENNDLRKLIYYKTNTDGSHAFKGSYAGSNRNDIPFSGIAADEMYLLRAECFARSNDVNSALKDLDTLLSYRYKVGTFVPIAGTDKDEVLKLVLNERRKELVYRGLRWIDLRRLNFEAAFQKTLVRKVNDKLIDLLPNESNYTFLIPQAVIDQNGWSQNTRQ